MIPFDQPTKGVCYLRVSRQTQETQRQAFELIEHAKKFNVIIEDAGIFSDKITGVSKQEDRPEFSKMIKYIDENKIPIIFTTELSRIGRDQRNTTETLYNLIDKKINVYFKENMGLTLLNQDTLQPDIFAGLILNILQYFNAEERKTAIMRNKSGMKYSIAKGGSGYGKYKPFGYKMQEEIKDGKKFKKLVIDEEGEKQIVIDIYNKYLEGLGTKQIANYLNANNIKTKKQRIYTTEEDKTIKYKNGNNIPVSSLKWKDNVIYGILKNPIYKGERILKEYDKADKKTRQIINTNIYKIDPIISEETFNKVQEKLNYNYTKVGNNNKYENILKNKIQCGECLKQNKITGYFMHKRANNKDNAYKCLSIRYNNTCGNSGIGIDRLNNSIYYLLKNYVKFNHNDNAEYINKQKTNLNNLQITRTNILTEITKTEKQFENILLLHLSNDKFQQIINDNETKLQTQINKLNEELENINIEIEETKKLIHNLENVKYDDIVNDVSTFKKYVSQTIDKIIINKVNDDKLKSIYTNKQDQPVHIKLITINQTEYNFIISQRTNIMLFILMDSFYNSEDNNTTKFEQTFIRINYDMVVKV